MLKKKEKGGNLQDGGGVAWTYIHYLETVIQSEVGEKDKNKYRMLTHIYVILKKNRF